MVGYKICGTNSRKEKPEVESTYFKDVLEQIKNGLGIYMKKDIKVRKNKNKVEEKDGKLILYDEDD